MYVFALLHVCVFMTCRVFRALPYALTPSDVHVVDLELRFSLHLAHSENHFAIMSLRPVSTSVGHLFPKLRKERTRMAQFHLYTCANQ